MQVGSRPGCGRGGSRGRRANVPAGEPRRGTARTLPRRGLGPPVDRGRRLHLPARRPADHERQRSGLQLRRTGRGLHESVVGRHPLDRRRSHADPARVARGRPRPRVLRRRARLRGRRCAHAVATHGLGGDARSVRTVGVRRAASYVGVPDERTRDGADVRVGRRVLGDPRRLGRFRNAPAAPRRDGGPRPGLAGTPRAGALQRPVLGRRDRRPVAHRPTARSSGPRRDNGRVATRLSAVPNGLLRQPRCEHRDRQGEHGRPVGTRVGVLPRFHASVRVVAPCTCDCDRRLCPAHPCARRATSPPGRARGRGVSDRGSARARCTSWRWAATTCTRAF